ncbi:phage tail tape measure protein [Diaphorobacter sp. HDW4A]|uniref:phage tail tape measure protein n=1 Tax=Diaphorobacter sp. HDW4A TaxID=2714924 RepID=UPI00140953CB|nr:phage tail tape measure protein [Diaphorobacter sp. HDW4A]QIL80807.1 phage tail tape measure protein [Diaphorobacter sp. HDW4A]
MVDRLRLEVLMAAVDRVTAPLKGVARASAETSSALKKTRAELKALNDQQGAIANVQKQAAEFARLNNELKVKQALLDSARRSGTASEAQLKTQTEGVRKLTAAMEKQRAVAASARTSLNAMGVNGSLSAAQDRIKGSIESTTKAMERQRAELDKLSAKQQALSKLNAVHGKTMGRLAMVGATAAAGAHVGKRVMQTGLAPVDAFMKHEDAMMGVQRQVQGARDAQGNLTEVYRTAEREIRELSTRIPQSTVQIAEMYTAAARMEVPKDKLAMFVEMASEIATAFDATPDEIAESMGKIANNLKMPITEIRGLADTINYLDDNAISKGSDIIGFLNRVGGVAGTVGITGENMAALGSTLLTSGETEETAGTGVKAIFTNFAAATKGTKKFQGAVREIGMTPEQMQEGMSKDAVGTMLQVAEAIKKIPKKEQLGVMAELAGKEHVGRLAKLVTNTEELRRQIGLANSAEAKGSMAREASARNSALSAQLQMQKNRMFNALAIAGEPLKVAILDVLKAVNPWLEKLTQWMQKNPAVVSGILRVVIGAGALATVLGTVGVAVATMFGPMFIARFMLSRFLLNMVGVRAAAAGATPAMGLLGRMWGLLGRAAGAAGPWLLRASQWLGAWIGTLATYLPMVARMGMVMLRFLGPVGLLITAAVMLYQRWEDVKGGFKLLIQDMGAAAASGLQFVAGLAMRAFDAGASIVQGIANGITSRIQSVRDSISMAAGDAVDWFKQKLGIHSPSRVFMELGGYVSEGAAQGISGGAGMVRNAAVAMAAGSMVAMSPVMAGQGMGGAGVGPAGGADGGGTSIVITINAAPGMDPQAVAKAVAAELDKRERDKQGRRMSSLSDID